ncbi:hypothetical protein [Acaryochloris sp. IP29b_bin.148]|uniref:hypothetical protein n=1 Tax=Acaryochloris sp. IP29b_bin.148 TaxID=2969218 RepID=UPI00260537DE|nr:hypothetical protein [Acaryochloris sp. IP29b_bin.148]
MASFTSEFGDAEVLAMNGEAVKVFITPTKADLKDVVEISKAVIAMNVESSPDHGADASDGLRPAFGHHSFQLEDNRI